MPPPTWSTVTSAASASSTAYSANSATNQSSVDETSSDAETPPYMQPANQTDDYDDGDYDDDYATDFDDDYVPDDQTLAEELGIDDLGNPILGGRGRLFSVAGKNAPVAEFTDEFVVLHPPDRPFEEADYAPAEEIVIMMDDVGVLVNEIGERKKVAGARFNGREIFYFWQQAPGTLKHYAVWFDDQGMHHYLTINGQRITTDIVYKLRNMTHNGELTRFVELSSY